MTRAYTPPGWPGEVHPHGTEGFERTAVAWLFDLCPPDYRAHDVLRRYPVVLARFALGHVQAEVEAARHGLRTSRAELAGRIPPGAIDAVIAAYEREGARLAAAARGVELVDQALSGVAFVPRL